MQNVPDIPPHLQPYITAQNYEKYSSENQSTWRYILRQLKDFLSEAAYSGYVPGLLETGITIDKIPRIDHIDQKLQKLGWRAVPISGFIPPAIFMEFQENNILPIASDIRTVQHISYTPAPDIVHEAAGHAPFLIHSVFRSFLKKYAQTVRTAITNKEDFDQYEAIRDLSDIKEHPDSTPEQIKAAEDHLNDINAKLTEPSEASLLSRFIWWTAEYGLIGNLQKQKIYGAGLLSSIGEARYCLSDKVKKIKLDSSCVEYAYDITDYQPQLFVTPDFETLHEVLEDLKKQCAFYIGGEYGLSKAKKSGAVCTVELDTGLQISGIVEDFICTQGAVDFVRLTGACQLSYQGSELEGQGKKAHSQGWSSPFGVLKNSNCPLSRLSESEIRHRYTDSNGQIRLEFVSGWTLEGRLRSLISKDGKNLVLQFQDCHVKKGNVIYFKPEWGVFDLAVGEKVRSVFGGPADRVAFGDLEDFVIKHIPIDPITDTQKKYFAFYQQIINARQKLHSLSNGFEKLMEQYNGYFSHLWLAGVEILELAYLFQRPVKEKLLLKNKLLSASDISDKKRPFIRNAVQLIEREHQK